MPDNTLIEPPRLVPLTEVCRRIGVSPRTGYRWIAEEKFPITPLRVGAKIMFRPADVVLFVEGR